MIAAVALAGHPLAINFLEEPRQSLRSRVTHDGPFETGALAQSMSGAVWVSFSKPRINVMVSPPPG